MTDHDLSHKCRDYDCQKRLNEVCTTLWGHSGENGFFGTFKTWKTRVDAGIERLSEKCVPKGYLYIAAIIVIIPSIVWAWNISTNHETRIAVLEKQEKTQSQQIQNIADTNHEILKLLQEMQD